MPTTFFQKNLNRLCQAAVKDEPDYDELQEAIFSLFELAEAEPAIKFVLKQMWDYLPKFENHYPNQRWPRETITLTEHLALFDVSSLEAQFFGSISLEDENQHPIPGALPFVNAIEGLYRVPECYLNRHKQNWREQGARKLAAVYFNLVLAQVWSRWASTCPDQYKAYWSGRTEHASTDEYVKSLDLFRESRERKQIWKEQYVLAADQLKQLLDNS